MKGQSKSKSAQFKAKDGRRRGPGHRGWGKKRQPSKYLRPQTRTQISKTGKCILKDVASAIETTGPIMQLRPRTACTVPEKDNPSKQEQNSYRMLHMGKTCEMFNTAYQQHKLQSPKCPTYLEFDFDAEQQKGVCWKETLKCRYCNFRSGQNNLYEEMQTDSRGPKTAKPNISLWVALMDNPIMGTSLQEIFLALNCPAPSYTGLQRNGGKVGPRMVEMVKEDLRRERTYLKDTLENCGYPRLTPIPVEGDGRYNNPLYWSRDRNPFQPATQSTYTISENVTSDKKIIGVTAKNKLCRKRTKGSRCPEHPGKCSASLTMDAPIGCEHLATEEICHDFLTDREPTLISHMTTDGDSAAFRGVQKAMREHGQTVEALRDTRHLAQSQKKAADNAKFSQNMFPGRTATERQATKRKFSVDLMKRCTAEYDIAQKIFCGDSEKLIHTLSFATDAIVECYSGRCGGTCTEHSLVCSGLPTDCWPKEYLPPNSRTLNPTLEDEETIRRLVDFRFSRSTITTTRYGTNTQKSEALHRGYSKSNPKNVTCAVSFEPQIYSAIHRMNHGPGKSTVLKCAALGAPLPEDTRVTRQLERKQEIYITDKKRKKSSVYRTRRRAFVKEKFEMYFQKKTGTEAGYSKGMSDPPIPKSVTRNKCEHSYNKQQK